jgi:hypothetical protein
MPRLWRPNSDLEGCRGELPAGLTTQNEAAKRQAQKRLNELAETDKRRRKLKRLNKKRRDEKWRQVLVEQESERLREMLKAANPLDSYTIGVRQVVSGGLPSLGKKR